MSKQLWELPVCRRMSVLDSPRQPSCSRGSLYSGEENEDVHSGDRVQFLLTCADLA